MIELGSKARDELTGYEGTIIGRIDWLYQASEYKVQAAKLDEEKPVDAFWFFEGQLEVLGPPAPSKGEPT